MVSPAILQNLKAFLIHLVSLAKWLSAHLQTWWLWLSPVAVTSLSHIEPGTSKEFLDIQAITKCRLTLKAYVT